MARAIKSVDISTIPELLRIAEEVHASGEPRLLRRDDEDLAVLMPAKKRRPGVPRGKPFTMSDPLWTIVGIGRSEGPTDVSANKHKYLAEAYLDLHDHE
ncbi:MAG: hypothetical protein HY691_13885 [Chloroflexi bacterium]|nr:hypothetical protein [Chloroflexota bacterium]